MRGDDRRRPSLVYVPHTTAGVTINEHADPAVARDFETALERIVADGWPWQHVEEGEENAPSHVRASFMGPSVLIPLRDDGELALGTWQGIFFCEFDGPRERTVYVTRSVAVLGVEHGVPCAMAAPVAKGRGARAPRRLARVRRQRRRAAERLRRLRPARAARRPRPRARHEGEAQPRRGARDRGARAERPSASRRRARTIPACGGCRFQDLAYEAQLAAKEAQVRDALRRIGGLAEPPLEPIVPAASQSSTTATSSSTRSRARRRGRRSASTGPAAGTRCSRSSAAGSRPTSATRSATPCATGRARRGSRRTPRRTAAATCATSSSARAATPARRSSMLVTAPGEQFETRLLRRGAAPLPRGALDPLGRQRHARRGDEPADASCSGARRRSRRSCSACASACGRTRSCRRTRRWPSGSTRSRSSTRR